MVPEAVTIWTSLPAYIVYLGLLFVGMVVYYEWKWAKTCKDNIQVLVAQQGGGGEYLLSPKDGGQVSIKNPITGTIRMWPVNELSTIDVLYPGVGFVPTFLQKTIRLAIVNEGDWEPMLNRSAHQQMVASPDVISQLQQIANGSEVTTKAAILNILDSVRTSPTREMIASPAVLGNLMEEKISELAVTVGKEIINPINEAIKKLGKQVSPVIVYIGLGLILVVMAFMAFKLVPSVTVMTEKQDTIMRALGIDPDPVPTITPPQK
jgi:hypothetical protein